MTAPCPRIFEAEAMRYGRLDRAERASFERHRLTCPACSREVRALDAVADAVRASSPAPKDDLNVRRERMRLLSAYDRELVAPRRHRKAPLFPSLSLAALVVGFLVFLRVQHGAHHAPIVALVPTASVHAEGSAAWSRRWQGDREEIVLERGALSIKVDHSSGKGPVLVRLPDGELEDIGTTFSVTVEDNRTTCVAVDEGTVALRLRGQPSVVLDRGAVWMPDGMLGSPVSARPTAAAAVSVTPLSSALPPRPRYGVKPRATAEQAFSEFRDAMAALNRGDNRGAERAFVQFIARHPRDARSEDAAYLRVIALQRCADDAMMKQAAREYLRRYPSGLRRSEVERLLGDTEESPIDDGG